MHPHNKNAQIKNKTWNICEYNVGKNNAINHPFGNGFNHLFIAIWEMVDWFYPKKTKGPEKHQMQCVHTAWAV